MDERHWWIASNIQRTFKIHGTYSPDILESYLSEEKFLNPINEFLQRDGSKRLFVYYYKSLVKEVAEADSLVLTTDVPNLEGSTVILYFLRSDTGKDVDQNRIHTEVLCGEIKQDCLKNFAVKLSEIYLPLFKVAKEWGKCPAERQGSILNGFEKYSTILNDSSPSDDGVQTMILKIPEELVDVRQMKFVAQIKGQFLDSQEHIVSDWISHIESFLFDAEERLFNSNSGPMTEVEKWKRKQKILLNITQQLKSKQCKQVISSLVAGRSKMLRKWKIIDSGITEAINESKDKSKYLESIRNFLTQLQHNCSPEDVMKTIIPGVMRTLKMQDSLSRHYGRSGFLGLLLKKIANQLVTVGKNYLHAYTTESEGEDMLWRHIVESVAILSSDGNTRKKQDQGSNKYKGTKVRIFERQEDCFYKQLKSCIQMRTYYQNAIGLLHGAIFSEQGMSRSTSHVSLPPASHSRTQRASITSITDFLRTINGISLQDEEGILSNLNIFSHRLQKVIDIIETLVQFSTLWKSSLNIPLPRKEELELEDQDPMENNNPPRSINLETSRNEDHKQISDPTRQDGSPEGQLLPILEENISDDEVESILDKGTLTVEQDENKYILVLRKYFEDDSSYPFMSSLFKHFMQKMENVLQTMSTTDMLHVEMEDEDKFCDAYKEFSSISSEYETLIVSYLKTLFNRDLPVPQALDVLSRFSCVSNRESLASVINHCYMITFNSYTSDLEKEFECFELHKEDPPLPRNIPRVAGTIQWCRCILDKIKEPMEELRHIPAVSHLKAFPRTSKRFNEIVAKIKVFEKKSISMWERNLENVANGLKVVLLVQDPQTKELVVNLDYELLDAIQEVMCLTKMGNPLSASAATILSQENKLKNYKMHLEMCLSEVQRIKELVPQIWLPLFRRHFQQLAKQFQPGLTSLTWNSMNIDAFLHKVRTATNKMEEIVNSVNSLVQHQIGGSIQHMEEMVLITAKDFGTTPLPHEDFKQKMFTCIGIKTQELNNHVLKIQETIDEILDILSTTTIRVPSSSKKNSVEHSKSEDYVFTDTEKKIISKKILNRYKDSLFNKIKGITMKTLLFLSSSLGCDEKQMLLPQDIPTSTPAIDPEPPINNDSEDARIVSRPRTQSTTGDSSEIKPFIQICSVLSYNIPNIVMQPSSESINESVMSVVLRIRDMCKGIFLNDIYNEKLHQMLSQDEEITDVIQRIKMLLFENKLIEDKCIEDFKSFDFLWKKDRYESFEEFMATDPSMKEIHGEVEKFVAIEKEIATISSVILVGLISVRVDPLKYSLQAMVVSFKTLYASVLHEDAKNWLDQVQSHRTRMYDALTHPIENLDQLHRILKLLHQIRDLQNKTDQVYLAIEKAYKKLRIYGLQLPRSEIKDVRYLRTRWQNLVELSEDIEKSLFSEKRASFEQEIDGENMAFVVKVMQYRNSFDGEGPNVPNLLPEEAVVRLDRFQKEYSALKRDRDILESVAKIYGVNISTYPELDKTEEELELLSQLYGLYVRFLKFDDMFRNTLWADIDFIVAIKMIESIWDEYLRLPHKLSDCYAYHNLRRVIEVYQKVIPILKLLNSKEIRNRHWLQVMNICETSFPLEASVFKLYHLLDINLDEYHTEINEICEVAQKEMELEIKMNQIEEEWLEQVLLFQDYKKLGPIVLDQDFTGRLLEQLEDSQVTLANMLMSQHIAPMREDVATWSEKLKEVSHVLDLWLNVQNLWIHLEAVFCKKFITKNLQHESQKFAAIHVDWTKIMKKSYETKNVIQTCCGGDVPLPSILLSIQEGLEFCFRSLEHYLEKKRMEFPRFFFISDLILLAILSCTQSLESVTPYLKSLFGHIAHIETESINNNTKELDSQMCQSEVMNEGTDITASIQNGNEEFTETEKKIQIVAVKSSDGEKINLNKKVFLEDNVEEWLRGLKKAVSENISELSLKAIHEVEINLPFEELSQKYPTQVCHLSTLYYWSMEIESGIQKLKHDRKALSIVYKKFHCLSNKMYAAFNKTLSKGEKELKSTVQHIRLESLATQANYLRDLLDSICQRKIKECSDFEWRRTMKCYLLPDADDIPKPHLAILDNKIPYGGEFCGSTPNIIVTPNTDKCFLFITRAIYNMQGVCLIGPTEVGKKETLMGLADTVAQYNRPIQCFPELEPSCLARIIQGCSLEGCWACFLNGNQLSPTCLAVAMDHIAEILNIIKIMDYQGNQNQKNEALDSDRSTPNTESLFSLIPFIGDLLPNVNPSVAFFMTMTVQPSSDWNFPPKVKSVFRTVSLIKPDAFLILKGNLFSVGFKGASFLAGRLLEIASLARNDLPAMYSSRFHLSSLISTVKRAYQIQASRDDKSWEKLETILRPESQVSTSTNKASPGSTSRLSQVSSGARNSCSAVHVKKTDLKILVQAIEESLSMGMDADTFSRFQALINAAIYGTTNVAIKDIHKSSRLEKVICKKLNQMNLTATKPFLEKCIQLNTANNIYKGILVVGPPGSGKSTCLQVLAQALNEATDKKVCPTVPGYSNQKSSDCGQKLVKINPLTVDNFELMFSGLDSNEQLVDGLLTSTFKKANRNTSKTWIVLDAPVNPGWMDYLASAVQKKRMIHLKNGDVINMNENVKLFFETDNMQSASPTTLCKLGLVYVDGIVGWEILAKTWIKARKNRKNHVNGNPNVNDVEEILMKCFQTSINGVVNFLKTKTRHSNYVTEAGMFINCLQMLTQLLSDKLEVAGNAHIKKLFLFCLLWAFGGHLNEEDKKNFSRFLMESRTNVYPEEEKEEDINLFDYFVDESGEWESWSTKPTEYLTDSLSNLNGEFTYTTRTPFCKYNEQNTVAMTTNMKTLGLSKSIHKKDDSPPWVFRQKLLDIDYTKIPVKYFMELLIPNGFPILLCGPHGSGKTALIKDLMNIFGQQEFVYKRLVYSGSTTAKQLLDFIQTNIYHRQGFVHGAVAKKKLGLFIEDINLPKPDEFGVQRCNELLRQVVGERLIYNLKSPFEIKCIEGLSVMAEFTTTGLDIENFNPRLMRHFSILNVPPPHEDDLVAIISKKLECVLNIEEQPTIDGDLFDGIVDASSQMLLRVQSILNQSPLAGRQHYIFTLHNIQHCFQIFTKLSAAQRTNKNFVLSLWQHEVQRVFLDSVSRISDLNFLGNLLNSFLSQKWPDLDLTEKEHFVTIPVKSTVYSQISSPSELHAVKNLSMLHDCLQGYLTRYNAAKLFNHLDILLSEYTISHVIRIHRILSYQRGHLLTISSLGSGIEKLCILACEVANVSIVKMEGLQGSDFIDGLKDAVRQAGTTAHPIAILLDTKNLQNPIHLDCINSFLVTEDYTSIFSKEELPTILQALVPEGKKDHQEKRVEPAVYFTSQINHNLHILINLAPTDNLLSTALSTYPCLLKVCQINWMCDWLKDNLLSTANYFLKESHLFKEPEMRFEITSCLADIHHLMLMEYKSAPWAGDMSATICLHTVKHSEKKKEKVKICKETVTNLPYTQSILMEYIQMQQESPMISGKSHITLSMQEYEQLLHCFEFLYSKKNQEKEEKIVKIKKSLEKLNETRKMLFEMKETVTDITLEYEEAKSKAESLLALITMKATKLQTLKAKIGMNSSIQAILDINEIKSNFDDSYTEDNNLLKIDDYDEFDLEFDRIRKENMVQSKKKIEENLASARKMYSLKKKCVQKSRAQVYYWLHKIDRNCIESIKGFAKPPSLVLHIADMMMILTGRHNPLSALNVSTSDASSIGATPASSAGSINSQKGQSKRRTDLSWKTIQQILSESKNFTDLLHNLPLEEGLNPSMMKTLSSYISQKEIERSRNSIEPKIQDVNGRSSSQALEEGITISAAKYASEDAAILLQYMLALLVYSMFFRELKEIKETIQALQEQIQETGKQVKEKDNETSPILEDDKDEELHEEDLPMVEQELEALQREYSCAVEKKATLEGNLQSKNEKLLATSQLLTSLKKKELEWESYVEEQSNEVLVTNTLLASAFMTYCGPFGIKNRRKLCDSFIQVCEEHHLPEPYHKLFKNLNLHQYIFPPMLQIDLEIRQMPMTEVFLENCCFFVEEKSWTKWPLICDPNHRAIGWCRNYLQGTNFVEVNLHDLKSHLDNCLTDGTPLLLTECDPLSLSNDQNLCCIIGASKRFLQATESFKMNVGDHEVECKSSFRLYLHTSSEADKVGDFLAAFTKRFTFPQSVDCLTIQLLLRCLDQEKNRVKEERFHLLQMKEKQSQLLQKAETELITEFCKDISIMNEMPTLKNLFELVKNYEDLQENLQTVDKDLESILQQAKDQYLIIASRGALCYNVIQSMKELNPLYQFPYPRFLKMFDSIVSQSDRSLAKSVAEKLLFISHQKIVQRLKCKDRIVFTLLLAMEMEVNEGRIQEGEREFLISPISALQTLPSLANGTNLLTKNCFDWMPDEVYSNLQTLAMKFDWFFDIFMNMNKDGKDTSWKTLYECESPEICSLPDKLNKSLTPIQRFCVLRALRGDRVIQLTTAFISTVLGNKFVSDSLLNIPLIIDQSNPTTPILMLAFDPSIDAEIYFSNCSKGKGNFETISLNISIYSSMVEAKIKRFIWQKMSEGVWLLLNNAHSWPDLLVNILSWLKEKKIVNPMFRCWLSIDVNSCQIPSHLLNSSLRLIMDSPINVKDNMLQSFSHMDPDILKKSSNPLWPAMIHNICLLHATLRLRACLKNTWFYPEDIWKNDSSELLEAIDFAATEFKDSVTYAVSGGGQTTRIVSWNGIRNILSEGIFGRYLQHAGDRFCLAAMVEQLISLCAVKKDFEYTKSKYKTPATFFQNNVKLPCLIQALDALPNHILDSPEGCHLYRMPTELQTSSEQQYTLNCLNSMWSIMLPTSKYFPQTMQLTHRNDVQVWPQSKTILNGIPAASSCLSSMLPFCPDIWEICMESLSKLPRIHSKENLQTRMNKIGGATVYNRFIFGEIAQLNNLIQEIKTTLQTLKSIFEGQNLGDNLREHLIQVAEAIFLQKIPEIWIKMLGPTSLVSGTSLTVWFQDLQNRSTHLEKISHMGREKMPTYWLGAFLNPQKFLSLFKLEFMMKMANENVPYERISTQTIITGRDKDHIRDPPAEGVFLYGIYTWGFTWDKATGEALDSLPKCGGAGSLPVVHLYCTQEPKDNLYPCPVYTCRENEQKECIFELDVYSENIAPTRWSLRGIMATLQPF